MLVHDICCFIVGKLAVKVTDGQLSSEEKALHIVVIPKHSPFIRKHESALAFVENETTIGPQQVDIGVDSLEETVTISVLQGKSISLVPFTLQTQTQQMALYNICKFHCLCLFRTKSWTDCEQGTRYTCDRSNFKGLVQ